MLINLMQIGLKTYRIDIAKSLTATSGWTAWALTGTIGNEQVRSNSSYFTALPGGNRSLNGLFLSIGNSGC
jgi:hypothetical protein